MESTRTQNPASFLLFDICFSLPRRRHSQITNTVTDGLLRLLHFNTLLFLSHSISHLGTHLVYCTGKPAVFGSRVPWVLEFCRPAGNRTRSRGVTGCHSSCAFSHKTSLFEESPEQHKKKITYTQPPTSPASFYSARFSSSLYFLLPLNCSCVLHNQLSICVTAALPLFAPHSSTMGSVTR